MTPKFFGRLPSSPGIVAIKEVLTDLQHLEALFDAVKGRLKILQTFRAFLTGLLLGAAGGFINVFAVPACVRIAEVMKKGDISRAVEIQRRLNRCFPRGGEEIVGHLGTTKVTASVVTGIEMGPPRPPYLAPPDAEEHLRKRLPDLLEVL
jgi:dihydrodipicolinate synthase/N-acetylneuraminate lyase